MIRSILLSVFVGASVILSASCAQASIDSVMNQADISGNVQGTTNHFGNTTGGLGLRGSLFSDGFFGTAKYRHEFGPAFEGYTGGDSDTLALKLGYLFPASASLAVGPYLGYAYNRFAEDNAYYGFHAAQTLDDLGGGLYAAASLPGAELTGYVGYLGGISETDHVAGFVPVQYDNASDLLQVGVNVYYPLIANLSLFVGLHDDDFTEAGAPNILRGDVGLGAQF